MFRQDKFKMLVHYICWRCRADPASLGAVKLNKILWFSDVIAFAERGAPITGARYVKQKFGPVPKPILPALSSLETEGALQIDEVEYFGRRKRQYVALTEPDRSIFDQSEISTVDKVIETVTQGHTATSVSDLTHDAIWKLADLQEEIPLHAVLASRLGSVSGEDVNRARQRMTEAA